MTPNQFKAGLSEPRTGIAAIQRRLVRWMVGTVASTGILTVAILRLVG